MSQEQAQKLVDIYPQIQQQQAEARSKQVSDWGEQVKADKEIGGDKFNASVGAAQRALDQFGNTELREYLNASGRAITRHLFASVQKSARRWLKTASSCQVKAVSVARPTFSTARRSNTEWLLKHQRADAGRLGKAH